MRLILHRRRAAAIVADCVYYAPHIAALEPAPPERRFVAALCLYSHAVDAGSARRLYDQSDAALMVGAAVPAAVAAAGA